MEELKWGMNSIKLAQYQGNKIIEMQRKEIWKNSETPNTITDLIHNLERARNKIPNREKKSLR